MLETKPVLSSTSSGGSAGGTPPPPQVGAPASPAAFEAPKKRKFAWTRKAVTLFLVFSFLFGSLGALFYDTVLQDLLIAQGWVSSSSEKTIVRNQTPVTVIQNDAVVKAVAKVDPAVVSIISHVKTRNFFDQQLDNVASGSGFILTADGLIATNKHVIDGANTISVLTQEGKQYDAKLVDKDPLSDFAILRIEAKNLPVVELGFSDQLKIGEQVIAIGNALGSYDNTVTSGILSGINRTIVATDESHSDSSQLEGLLQIDAPINQGNSGGPLVNLLGQVIGVNTAVDKSGEGIGFAIPINDLRPAVESVIAKGKIVRPLLGVRYVNITPELAALNKLPSERGALVTGGANSTQSGVVTDGPAAKAGIKENDIILLINDVEINKDQSLIRVLSRFKPNEQVTVTYLRDEKKVTVKVTLGQANNN